MQPMTSTIARQMLQINAMETLLFVLHSMLPLNNLARNIPPLKLNLCTAACW